MTIFVGLIYVYKGILMVSHAFVLDLGFGL